MWKSTGDKTAGNGQPADTKPADRMLFNFITYKGMADFKKSIYDGQSLFFCDSRNQTLVYLPDIPMAWNGILTVSDLLFLVFLTIYSIRLQVKNRSFSFGSSLPIITLPPLPIRIPDTFVLRRNRNLSGALIVEKNTGEL